jgi:thiol-disulfide isomerase/thioredoxin
MNIFKPFLLVLLLVVLAGFIASTQKMLPNLEFTALNGKKMSLHGKPTVVTFWTTDCASCLKEIPIFIELHSRFHTQGLEIVGVSMYYEPPNQVIEFLKKTPLLYPITLDIEAKLANAFNGVNATPTTFLLNPKGKIVWQKAGLIDVAELQPKIETLLKEN